MLVSYRNINVIIILLGGAFLSISMAISSFSTTWLIYAFGGSNADLGRILGISTLIGSLFTLFSSYIGDRYSKIMVLSISVSIGIIGIFMIAYSNSLQMIFYGSIISSIGVNASWPVLFALFTDSVHSSERNRVFGTQFLISNISYAGGNFITYFLFINMKSTEIKNLDISLIKFSLQMSAYIFLIAGTLLFFIRNKHIISEKDEGSVASNYIINKTENDTKVFDKNHFAPGALKILILSLLSSYIIGAGAGITIPYLNRFFFDIYKVDLSSLSMLFGIMTIITAIYGKIISNLSDNYGRVELIAVNQIISVILLVILATEPPLIFAFLTLFTRNAAMNSVGPIASAIQMEYTPRKYRSQFNAINEISWAVFFSVGQILGGIVVDNFGFTIPILTTATLYFIATIFYWNIRRIIHKNYSVTKT